MIIDFSELSASGIYYLMTQSVLPRPVAWVLSANADDTFNLAPFSYFTAVSSKPPLLLISVGMRPQGGQKDTRANIEQRKNFVVHVAHTDLLEPLNQSSAPYPPGVSELDALGMQTVDFSGSPLPRLAACRVAFACERYQVMEVGEAQQCLLLGRIRSLYVDDCAIEQSDDGRLRIDAAKLDPVARLGAGQYARLGEIFTLERPAQPYRLTPAEAHDGLEE